MADPRFPNVPQTLGVPAVRRDGPYPPGVGTALQGQFAALDSAKKGWGIYNQAGALVLEPDNIAGFEYAADYRLSDYPLEKGSFESYNKVEMPFDVRVVMSKGGTLAERTAFQKKLESIQGDRILYNVATPEKTYLNVNISHVAMSRTSDRGAAMLTMEIGLREIRQNATLAYSTSPTPEVAPPAPTPQQDKRPPTTNPGTTKAPSASRRVSRGPTQTRPSPNYSEGERYLIRRSGESVGRTVTFSDEVGGASGRF